jgi:hypothetical protein
VTLRLGAIREQWQALAAAASVAIGTISTSIHPPPVGDARSFVTLAAFFATGVSGLTYVAMNRWSSVRYTAMWSAVAALALLGSFAGERYYDALTDRYVATFQGERKLAGDEFTPDGAAWVRQSGHTGVDDLIFDAAGVPDRIWTTPSIQRVRLRMRAAYYACVPAFALAVLAVVQAVYCATRQTRRVA